jgi:SWI/SNF-related matrix-associated actin-dependent regulator 1 of chromatin subfamily A
MQPSLPTRSPNDLDDLALRPFQDEGARWLASRRYALLADDMGLGKTPQAITACDLVSAARVVVVCPALGRVNWVREFNRWSIVGPDVRVYSFDEIVRDKKRRDAIRAFRPQVIIVDEAHALKNPESKRTQKIYGRWCRNDGLAMIPKHVWLLTGTIAPNNVTELWPHFRALWPELITINGEPLNLMGFTTRYAEWKQTDFGVKVFGNNPKHLPEIRQALGSVMLRRKAKDVLKDLPPIVWQPTYLIPRDHITRQLLELEQSVEVQELERIFEAAAKGETRELFTDEEPVALATVRRLTAEIKAPAVGNIIAEELTDHAYDKIVIFARHRAALSILHEALRSFGVCTIIGGQTDNARQQEIDSFQRDPALRVALVQLDAGYHTVTLHAAAQVAFLEQSWTPDINVQAAKRCHRFGQTRPVFVRNFGLEGSIDEAVSQALSRKAQSILELLGA